MKKLVIIPQNKMNNPIVNEYLLRLPGLLLAWLLFLPFVFIQAASIQEGGFESPDLTSVPQGFLKNVQSGSSWTFSQNSGITNNVSPFALRNPAIPQCNQALLLHKASSVTQQIELSAGTYHFAMWMAQRERKNFTDQQEVVIRLNNQIILTTTPTNKDWQWETTQSISVAAGNYTLTIESTHDTDWTALVDDFQLIAEQTIQDGSFEAPDVSASPLGFIKNIQSGSSWTFSPFSGITNGSSPFASRNPVFPDPDQALLLHKISSVSKQIQLPAGTFYFSMWLAQRERSNSTDQQEVVVKLDDQIILTTTPTSKNWQLETTESFTVIGGTYSLLIESTQDTDWTALIDEIKLFTEQSPEKWSAPTTWANGQIPGPNDAVVIAPGRMILIDTDVNVKHIKNHGVLIADQSKDLNLVANYIVTQTTTSCAGEAKFLWGSENNPYTKNATITLKTDLADTFQHMGTKFLGAISGAVEIHGSPKISWTQLRETANGGEQIIKLRKQVDWNIGDRIVISSTDFDVHQTEEKIIANITQTFLGSDITLVDPLQHMHFGERLSYTSPNSSAPLILDESAEVGLLTRNIRIQGDASSESSRIGGHTMFHKLSSVRFSGVELYRMGQLSKLGRYPFHWHRAEDVPGQYIKNSSVWRSFNRAITVHGTNEALVEDNVAYNFIGHGFYLENGSEINNVFKGNLGVLTRAPTPGEEVREHDLKPQISSFPSIFFEMPSTFWITNPQNDFIGNVSGGSEGSGFWVLAQDAPTESGTSGSGNTSPRTLPLGKFENNRSHSSDGANFGFSGRIKITADINPNTGENVHLFEPNATYAPLDDQGNSMVTTIRNNTAFKAKSRNFYGITNSFKIDSCYMGDAGRNVRWSGHTIISNSLIVGISPNASESLPYPLAGINYLHNQFGGLAIYTGPYEADGVHFEEFNRVNTAAILIQPGGVPVHEVSNLTFGTSVNFENRVNFYPLARREDAYSIAVRDLDGSLTGLAATYVCPKIQPAFGDNRNVYEDLFNREPTATFNSDWSAYKNTSEQFGRNYILNGWGGNLQNGAPIYNIREGLNTHSATLGSHHSAEKGTPIIINNIDYTYYWQYHRISNKITPQLQNVQKDDFVISAYTNMPSSTKLYEFCGSNCPNAIPLPTVANLEVLKNSPTQAYLFKDNTIYIKHVADREPNIGFSGPKYSYASKFITICQEANCTNPAQSTSSVTLADYEMGADSRTISLGNGLADPNWSFAGDAIPGGLDDYITWDITNDGDPSNDFNQVGLEFPRQVWTYFQGLQISLLGIPQFEVLIRDKNQGTTSLGVYNSGIDVSIPLSAIGPGLIDEIDQIWIRVRESYLPAGTSMASIRLFDMQLSVSPASSNQSASPKVSLNEAAEYQSEKDRALQIYPNPTREQFTLSKTFKENKNVSISITNSIGQEVYRKEFQVNSGLWEKTIRTKTAGLSSGLYFINLETEDGGVLAERLIVE